jgi:lysophospholipase-2
MHKQRTSSNFPISRISNFTNHHSNLVTGNPAIISSTNIHIALVIALKFISNLANTLNSPIMDVAVANNALTDDALPSDSTTIVAPLGDQHSHTVIFLHGRDDFGEDLSKYFFDSKGSDGSTLAEIFPSVKWVFPTAKLRYSARRDLEFSSSSFAELLKGEEIISQWFDLWDVNSPYEKQELMLDGVRESIEDILDIIQKEADIAPLERIVLGGISQGCATAILALLSSGINLGGFVGMCSWLPFQNDIANLPSSFTKNQALISQQIRIILQMPISKGNVAESNTHDIDKLDIMLNGLSVC